MFVKGGQISEVGAKFPRKFGPPEAKFPGAKFPRKFGPGGPNFRGGQISCDTGMSNLRRLQRASITRSLTLGKCRGRNAHGIAESRKKFLVYNCKE